MIIRIGGFFSDNNKLFRSCCFFIFLISTFILSFQYFFIADFPIGPDVVNHIANEITLEKIGYLKAFSHFIYPLSVIAFDIYHKFLAFFGFTWEKSFIFTLCLNVFIAAILTGILAKKIFNDWRVGALASVLLASSRWINDSMRIGLLAETFGWIFLILSLIFLLERKWKYLVVSALLLFFFHPMVFGIFLVFSMIISIYLVIWGEEGDKKIARYFLLAVFSFAIIFFFWKNSTFQEITSIIYTNFTREGERSIANFITDWDKRRAFIYAFALMGFFNLVIFNIKNNKKVLFLVLFAIFSFLVCFKHFLGIHYLGYRFYTYFEISSAILAAYGMTVVLNIITKERSLLMLLLLTYFLVVPNWQVGIAITKWQSTDYTIGSITPKADRDFISETNQKIKPNANIMGPNLWGGWYRSKSGALEYFSNDIVYSDSDSLYNFIVENHINYVFFSSMNRKSLNEENGYLKIVAEKEGARLYEFVR